MPGEVILTEQQFNDALGVKDWKTWRGKRLVIDSNGESYPVEEFKAAEPRGITRAELLRNRLLQEVVASVKETKDGNGQGAVEISLDLLEKLDFTNPHVREGGYTVEEAAPAGKKSYLNKALKSLLTIIRTLQQGEAKRNTKDQKQTENPGDEKSTVQPESIASSQSEEAPLRPPIPDTQSTLFEAGDERQGDSSIAFKHNISSQESKRLGVSGSEDESFANTELVKLTGKPLYDKKLIETAILMLAQTIDVTGKANKQMRAYVNTVLKLGEVFYDHQARLADAGLEFDSEQKREFTAEIPYIDATDKEGSTALMHAAGTDNTHVVKMLLDAKADLHATNKAQQTALTFALTKDSRNMSVVATLVEHKADPHAKDQEGKNFIMQAVSCWETSSTPQAVKKLLEAKADINGTDNQGVSALQIAVNMSDENIVEFLLDGKADPNNRDKEGQFPLETAIRKGDLNNTKLLLDAKADPNSKDAKGIPVLVSAVEASFALAELMLDAKANPSVAKNGSSLLDHVTRAGHVAHVRKLMEAKAQPTYKEIVTAVQVEDSKKLELLLTAKPPLDIETFQGNPLMKAVLSNNEVAVKLLLEAKANPLHRVMFESKDGGQTATNPLVDIFIMTPNAQRFRYVEILLEHIKANNIVLRNPEDSSAVDQKGQYRSILQYQALLGDPKTYERMLILGVGPKDFTQEWEWRIVQLALEHKNSLTLLELLLRLKEAVFTPAIIKKIMVRYFAILSMECLKFLSEEYQIRYGKFRALKTEQENKQDESKEHSDKLPADWSSYPQDQCLMLLKKYLLIAEYGIGIQFTYDKVNADFPRFRNGPRGECLIVNNWVRSLGSRLDQFKSLTPEDNKKKNLFMARIFLQCWFDLKNEIVTSQIVKGFILITQHDYDRACWDEWDEQEQKGGEFYSRDSCLKRVSNALLERVNYYLNQVGEPPTLENESVTLATRAVVVANYSDDLKVVLGYSQRACQKGHLSSIVEVMKCATYYYKTSREAHYWHQEQSSGFFGRMSSPKAVYKVWNATEVNATFENIFITISAHLSKLDSDILIYAHWFILARFYAVAGNMTLGTRGAALRDVILKMSGVRGGAVPPEFYEKDAEELLKCCITAIQHGSKDLLKAIFHFYDRLCVRQDKGDAKAETKSDSSADVIRNWPTYFAELFFDIKDQVASMSPTELTAEQWMVVARNYAGRENLEKNERRKLIECVTHHALSVTPENEKDRNPIIIERRLLLLGVDNVQHNKNRLADLRAKLRTPVGDSKDSSSKPDALCELMLMHSAFCPELPQIFKPVPPEDSRVASPGDSKQETKQTVPASVVPVASAVSEPKIKPNLPSLGEIEQSDQLLPELKKKARVAIAKLGKIKLDVEDWMALAEALEKLTPSADEGERRVELLQHCHSVDEFATCAVSSLDEGEVVPVSSKEGWKKEFDEVFVSLQDVIMQLRDAKLTAQDWRVLASAFRGAPEENLPKAKKDSLVEFCNSLASPSVVRPLAKTPSPASPVGSPIVGVSKVPARGGLLPTAGPPGVSTAAPAKRPSP